MLAITVEIDILRIQQNEKNRKKGKVSFNTRSAEMECISNARTPQSLSNSMYVCVDVPLGWGQRECPN